MQSCWNVKTFWRPLLSSIAYIFAKVGQIVLQAFSEIFGSVVQWFNVSGDAMYGLTVMDKL